MLLTSEYDITLQTNAFVAYDEIVSAAHLQVNLALQTNTFIASDECV